MDEDTAGETGNIGAAGDVLEVETAKETAPQAKTAEHAFESKMEVSELLFAQKKPGVARLLQNCAFTCFGETDDSRRRFFRGGNHKKRNKGDF